MIEIEADIEWEEFHTLVRYDPAGPDDLVGIACRLAEMRIKADVPEKDIVGIYHGDVQRLGAVAGRHAATLHTRVCMLKEAHTALLKKGEREGTKNKAKVEANV
jgi:hypothetical protein